MACRISRSGNFAPQIKSGQDYFLFGKFFVFQTHMNY
jgi:hypothetical protein